MILIVLLILVLAAGGCLLAIRKEINGSASAGKTVSVSCLLYTSPSPRD